MADFQIGDNLYSEDTGKYYNLLNGKKSYVKSPYETASDKINQMYDAQNTSQLNALKAQRDKAIQGFTQQKKDLAPQYQSQRNQADVVNAQNVTRLRELMAANGINMSGENITAQAQMNSARQGAFNDINNNENQAYGAIDRQIAAENDPSREQSINDAIAAERSKALTDAFSQSQQQAYQQKMDWQNYQAQLRQEEMARQQFEWQKQMEQQQLAAQRAAAAQRATRSTAPSYASPNTAPKSKDQSYADWTGYFQQNANNIANMGLPEFEQQLRNNKSMMNQIQNQGYNLDAVIDALYSGGTGGRFRTKAEYDAFSRQESKRQHSSGGRAVR
jgi:hypothetical protein